MASLIKKRWIAFIHDALWVPVTLFCSFWLRFNLESIPSESLPHYFQLLQVVFPIQLLVFWFFGFHRGIWSFTSLPDFIRIFQSILVGSAIAFAIYTLLFSLSGMPRSVFILYPILLSVGLSFPRITYRLLREKQHKAQAHDFPKTLIIGAGKATDLLLRDIKRNKGYSVIGVLDDDPKKKGLELQRSRVLGSTLDLETLLVRHSIEVVLLAIPSATHQFRRKIFDVCFQNKVQCQMLPSLMELAEGKIQVSQIRSITVEDLLGRDPIQLDESCISETFRDRIVLVTGGGGSIGSELCRQIALIQPEQLLILEHSEFHLYSIEMELRKKFPELSLVAILGDVKDALHVQSLFTQYAPQVVFHAAAYKHVPMIEKNPEVGVINNVLGTQVLANAAHQHDVETFILISTDKAVNPTNVMGCTKRIAEKYVQNFNARSQTSFITTRFGNVLASTGSVVPLFQEQIDKGGPVTVTHEKITRYFMTIPEAVGLILQAGSMGEGGEIFVLNMGEPVKIKDLAEQMIKLSGLELGTDIQIEFTGLRPGEKLYEELFHTQENLKETHHSKLMLARSRQEDWKWLNSELQKLIAVAQKREWEKLHGTLCRLVPEFVPDEKKG